MSFSKILLIGNKGQLGWELQRALPTLGDVCAVDFPQIDLMDEAALGALLNKEKPAILVNAAAYTAVDKAQSEPQSAFAINARAPEIMARHCAETGALMVHYSTEYVYDGAKNSPYVETDAPAPQNEYGRSKLAGDQAVCASGARHLVLRTSWVYGSRAKNFLLTMLRLAKEGKDLRVVGDQRGTPTWCRTLAQATAQILATTGNAAAFPSGVYHLSELGETTWCGFARAILENSADLRGYDLSRLKEITTADYPTPAKRPKNSLLSKQKLQDSFGVRLPHWEDSLRLVLDELCR